EPAHLHPIALAPENLHHRQPNRVRPPRRARRKHPMRLPVHRSWPHQLVALRAVELPDHEQVREPLHIRQPHLELRQNLQLALGVVLRAQPFRNSLRIGIGTADIADRLRCKHARDSLLLILLRPRLPFPVDCRLFPVPYTLHPVPVMRYSDPSWGAFEFFPTRWRIRSPPAKWSTGLRRWPRNCSKTRSTPAPPASALKSRLAAASSFALPTTAAA